MTLRLGAVVDALGGTLHGDADRRIERLASLASAGPDSLSFLANPRHTAQLADTKTGCVVIAAPMLDTVLARPGTTAIVTGQPHLYFARLTQLWRREHLDRTAPRIHPSAVVDPCASVDPDAFIGALCVVERGAVVGAGSVLKSHVALGEDCVLGARCLVQSGAVIGADGFGFAPDAGRWEKIEQLGRVVIGDDVEIGANTCIDRGALDDTVIGDGVKLDNLIQIAHNVRVGAHTAMAACVGVAGSAVIGAHCTVGGAAMIAGHLSIADHVNISPGTLISRSIARPGTYTGFFPMDDNAAWEKNAATLRHLYALRERVRALEKK